MKFSMFSGIVTNVDAVKVDYHLYSRKVLMRLVIVINY